MESPNNLKKDAFHYLDQAQEIVQQAVRERRAMTATESSLVTSLRATGEPMLERAKEMELRISLLGVE